MRGCGELQGDDGEMMILTDQVSAPPVISCRLCRPEAARSRHDPVYANVSVNTDGAQI